MAAAHYLLLALGAILLLTTPMASAGCSMPGSLQGTWKFPGSQHTTTISANKMVSTSDGGNLEMQCVDMKGDFFLMQMTPGMYSITYLKPEGGKLVLATLRTTKSKYMWAPKELAAGTETMKLSKV